MRVRLKHATDPLEHERGVLLREVDGLHEVLLDSGKTRTFFPELLVPDRSSESFASGEQILDDFLKTKGE